MEIVDYSCGMYSILAGHYQQILDNIVHRNQGECSSWIDLKKLVKFCIENVDITAFQQLLYALLSWNSFTKEYNICDVISDILKAAARMSFIVRYHISHTNHKFLSSSLDSLMASSSVTRRREQKVSVCRTEKRNTSQEEAKNKGYMLLSAIYQRMLDNINQVLVMRNPEHVEYLLIAGIYCDAGSNISQIAFKLLKLIIYGSTLSAYESDSGTNAKLEEWTEMGDDVKALIDEYAEDFVFRKTMVTKQMIAALPIFWNHRYERLDDGRKYDPVECTAGADYEVVYTYHRQKGLTPLEAYIHLLLCNPPMSQFLNLEILKVIRLWINKCQAEQIKGTQEERYTVEFQRKLFDMEIVIYNVLTTLNYEFDHFRDTKCDQKNVFMMEFSTLISSFDMLTIDQSNCLLECMHDQLSNMKCLQSSFSDCIRVPLRTSDYQRFGPEKKKSLKFCKTVRSQNISDYMIDVSNLATQQRIGMGTSGEVNFKDNESTKFAAKFIVFSDDPLVTDHFIKEVKIMVQLHHPCILDIKGVSCPTDTSPGVILTEFAQNGSLEAILEQVRDKNPPELWNATVAAKIAVGIAVGMRYMHAKGIWHRNLKPSNILLDNDLYVRIGDFELSHFAHVAKTLTKEIASPIYAAPESFDDEYDERIDVYSYGLILFEIFAGERVFSPTLTLHQVVEHAETNIRPDVPSYIHKDIRQLIISCWSADPEERPSFSEIIQSFDRINFEFTSEVLSCSVRDYYDALVAWES